MNCETDKGNSAQCLVEKLTLMERADCQLWLNGKLEIPEDLKRKFAKAQLEDKRRMQHFLQRFAVLLHKKGFDDMANMVMKFQSSQTINSNAEAGRIADQKETT